MLSDKLRQMDISGIREQGLSGQAMGQAIHAARLRVIKQDLIEQESHSPKI